MPYSGPPPPIQTYSQSNGYSPSPYSTHTPPTNGLYWKSNTSGEVHTSHDRTPMEGGNGSPPPPAVSQPSRNSNGTRIVLRIGTSGAGPSSSRNIDENGSRSSTPLRDETRRIPRIKDSEAPRRSSGRLKTSPHRHGDPFDHPPHPQPPPKSAALSALLNDTTPGDHQTPKAGSPSTLNDITASDGFESRLRSRNKVDQGSPGISASGKPIKVSGAVKVSAGGNGAANKKRKAADQANQDFCSACRGIGTILCCDGCVRSFHHMCLEPPLRVDELPQEETWYCKQCRADKADTRQGSPEKPEGESRTVPNIIKELVRRVDETNPTQFRLPQDIRQFFAGVKEGAYGVYMDTTTEESRSRLDRRGGQEERDRVRIREPKGRAATCYVCAGSVNPSRQLITDPAAPWRQIASCDYCALHFHLDCLNPPLTLMPRGKWMCPNHVEQVMPNRRTVRTGFEVINVDDVGVANNGNIIVIPEEPPKNKLEYEDTIINRRKYRVPERVIRLDFWNKLTKKNNKRPRMDNEDSVGIEDENIPTNATREDLEAANLVLGLLNPTRKSGTITPSRSSDAMEVDGESDASASVSNGVEKIKTTPRITLRMPKTT